MDAETREPSQRAYEAGGYVDWRGLPETQKARFRAIERTIYAAGFEAARTAVIERIADSWSTSSNLRLRCGEMTAQEMRTVKAVVAGITADIRALVPQEPDHG